MPKKTSKTTASLPSSPPSPSKPRRWKPGPIRVGVVRPKASHRGPGDLQLSVHAAEGLGDRDLESLIRDAVQQCLDGLDLEGKRRRLLLLDEERQELKLAINGGAS